MNHWQPQEPRHVRDFVVIKNMDSMEFEFHLRGMKVAAVPVLRVQKTRQLDNIVDDLQNIHFNLIKWLDEHPGAALIPPSEGEGCEMVGSLRALE